MTDDADGGQNRRVSDMTPATPGTSEGTSGDDPTTGAPPPYRDLPPVTERELAARRRGLASAYIPGGEDPDPALTKAQEDRYVRLLIGMVVLIVGGGFLVTFIGLILAGSGS